MGSAPTISIAASVRRRSSRPTARCGRNAKPTPRSTIFFAVSIVSTSSATLGTSPARRKRPWVSVQSLEPRSKKTRGRSATSSRRARRSRSGQAAGRATRTSGSSRRESVSTSGWWRERASPISASARSTISRTSFECPDRRSWTAWRARATARRSCSAWGLSARPASGGALQIAAVLSICTYLLPDVLKRFQAAYPKVLITVRSGHSKEVLEMVLRAEAEIGLARSLHHPEVETLSLRDDPLVLVARPAAWPERERRARLEEVADRPLVFFDRGSSDWTLTHGLFRRAGLVPNVALEVETIETARRMVERGVGFAFLPHLAVGRELRRRTLAAIEIVDAEPISRSLDVIHPRARPLSGEARALLGVLRSALAQAGGRVSVRRRARAGAGRA